MLHRKDYEGSIFRACKFIKICLNTPKLNNILRLCSRTILWDWALNYTVKNVTTGELVGQKCHLKSNEQKKQYEIYQ